MRYTIEIDDSTKAGKSLLEQARELAKKMKGIKVFAEYDEAREDEALVRMMEEARKEGYADTDEVLRELGLK